MMVMVINQLYLGRLPRLDEIRRRPNSWQLQCFRRLESLLLACGADPGPFPLAPGRAGPQLGACLFQLEQFIMKNPDLLPTYGGFAPKAFREDGLLFPTEKYPQLAPYKSLDVSRLKLVGTGQWPMEDFMDSVLWVCFREPAFLLHGQRVRGAPLPNLSAESCDENLALARVWDAKSLLQLHPGPLRDGHFSRVFNAFKNEGQDRQIGDRRIPNARERHIDGPGSMLTTLSVPRFSHGVLGSITDRRDYYHQAKVTRQRSQSNLLVFPFSRDELRGTQALDLFEQEEMNPKSRSREAAGDDLAGIAAGIKRKKAGGREKGPQMLYAGFASLYQGDHLGVEFALQSHEQLLVGEDLLAEGNRLRGHHLPPWGPNYEGLIIDDYFALAVHPVSKSNVNSFAAEALARARTAYNKHKLEGSVEKDLRPLVQKLFPGQRTSDEVVYVLALPSGRGLLSQLCLCGQLNCQASRLLWRLDFLGIGFRLCCSGGAFHRSLMTSLLWAPLVRRCWRTLSSPLAELLLRSFNYLQFRHPGWFQMSLLVFPRPFMPQMLPSLLVLMSAVMWGCRSQRPYG